MFIDLAWRHVSTYPRNNHHQGSANHEAKKRGHEDEGDDLQDTGRDQAGNASLGNSCTNQPADQRVRRRRRDAVIPGNDIPDDGPDQRAENYIVIDDRWIDGAFADG